MATSPRTEGSLGENSAIEYITNVADRLDINYKINDFDSLVNQHSFARNLSVQVDGQRADRFIIAVPLNNRAPTGVDGATHPADDRSLSLALALALIEHYAATPPPVSLLFLFLGAEEGELEDYPLGSRLFLQTFDPMVATAGLYLDLREMSPSIDTYIGGGTLVSPAWLIRIVSRAAQPLDLRIKLASFRIQAIRTRIVAEESPVSPFIEAGIPFIGLRSQLDGTRADKRSSTRPLLGDYAALLTDTIARLDAGIPSEWDHHYLIFATPFGLSIVGESIFVLLLLAIFASLLLYTLFSPVRISRYRRLLMRNFWSALVLLLTLFSALEVSTIILLLLSRLHRTLDAWRYAPYIYVGLKIALTSTIITYLFPVIWRMPLSSNPSFYSAAAMFIGLINVLIGLLFNIAFSYFFAWMFFCIFAFTLMGRRWMRLVLLCLGPLPLIIVVYQILSLPLLPAIEFLVVEPLRGNILLTFFLLPPILLLVRLHLHGHPRGHAKWPIRHRLVALIGSCIALGLLIVALARPPFSTQQPQPISITEIIDTNNGIHSLHFESPAALDTIEFRFGDDRYVIDSTKRSHTIHLQDIPLLLTVSHTEEGFLSRRRHVLTIDPELPLRRVDVELRDQTELFFFDANYPVSLYEENRRAQLHIGLEPPLPLMVDYTLPQNLEPNLALRASTGQLTRPLISERSDIQFTTQLQIYIIIPSDDLY